MSTVHGGAVELARCCEDPDCEKVSCLRDQRGRRDVARLIWLSSVRKMRFCCSGVRCGSFPGCKLVHKNGVDTPLIAACRFLSWVTLLGAF